MTQPISTSPSSAPVSLRVIVVDDHPLYREGIVRALQAAGHAVVAEASDGQRALDLIREHRPDVALVDVSMPGLDGIDLVGALARHGPDVPVVLLSAFDDEPLVSAALEAGAAAYVTKAADRQEILVAVSAAASPASAPRALASGGDVLTAPRDGWIPRLTRQEHDLLELALRGIGKREMASTLGLDARTVRHALSSAAAKLGADTLTDAVDLAQRAGILRPPHDAT